MKPGGFVSLLTLITLYDFSPHFCVLIDLRFELLGEGDLQINNVDHIVSQSLYSSNDLAEGLTARGSWRSLTCPLMSRGDVEVGNRVAFYAFGVGRSCHFVLTHYLLFVGRTPPLRATRLHLFRGRVSFSPH